MEFLDQPALTLFNITYHLTTLSGLNHYHNFQSVSLLHFTTAHKNYLDLKNLSIMSCSLDYLQFTTE